MKKYGYLLGMALFALSACGDGDPLSEARDESKKDKIGDLTLKLIGSDTNGRQYRLRDASFTISGSGPFNPWPPFEDAGSGFSTTVSTETDPDAPVISLHVVEGSYFIQLNNSDWYLERFEEGSWTRVEQAVLLSTNYQFAYVYAFGVTSVAFRFGVDGELIDFRGGDLQIGIEIEQPGDFGDGGIYPDAGGGIIGGIIGGGLVGGGLVGGGTIGGGPIGGGDPDAGQ